MPCAEPGQGGSPERRAGGGSPIVETGGLWVCPLCPTAMNRWGTAPPSCSPGRKALEAGGVGGTLPTQSEPDALLGLGAARQSSAGLIRVLDD